MTWPRLLVGSALLLAPGIPSAAEQPAVRRYLVADGLAAERVHRIVRDSRGFLWFCGAGGLSRFDGYRFVSYGLAEGLPDPTVNDFLEARDGSYWVATNGGGLVRFNRTGPPPRAGAEAPPRFTAYAVGDEAATSRVNVLRETRDRRLWLGTDGGLFVLDGGSSPLASRRVDLGLGAPERLVHVWALAEDAQGNLWIGTSRGLACLRQDGSLSRPLGDQLGNVWTLLVDGPGRLWAGHERGLTLLDSQAGRSLRSWTESGSVNAVLRSADGVLWVGSENGLGQLSGDPWRVEAFRIGLSHGDLTALAEDGGGTLWIGTRGNGALKLVRHGLVSFGAQDGLPGMSVRSIVQDDAGTVCVTGDAARFHCWDGARFTAVPLEALIPDSVRFHCLRDHAGDWWLPSRRGAYRFSGLARIHDLPRRRPTAVYTTRDGLGNDDIGQFFEDARGNVWMVARGRARYPMTLWTRSNGRFRAFSEADGVPAFGQPISFASDRSHNVWVSFWDGSLARYRERDGRFTRLPPAAALSVGGHTLYADRSGRVWVGSRSGGLGLIEDADGEHPRVVMRVPASDLEGSALGSMTEDLEGRLYIGTARGVFRFEASSGRIKHYTIADGLAHSEIISVFRDRSGALWFGTFAGLSRLIPVPDRPRPPPAVFLDGLSVAGVAHPVSERGETAILGLELDPPQGRIRVDYLSVGMEAGEVARYQSRLDGVDLDWSAPTLDRSVTLAGLSPGAYRFQVRALGTDGGVSASPAVVSFTVRPPFWRRAWFLGSAALLLILAAYGAHRLRTSRLVELERVRTRIAADLHDDIGSSLSRMAIQSEVVLRQIAASHPEAGRVVEAIADAARGLVDTTGDIVWAIDSRLDDLDHLVLRVREFASDVFDPKGIAWTLDADLARAARRLTPESRRHVFLIFKEAMRNIVRHADCHHVWMRLAVEGHRLVAEIRDDGRGFDGATLGSPRRRGGHGLRNMRARAEQLGGRLEIEATPLQGTRLALSVHI